MSTKENKTKWKQTLVGNIPADWDLVTAASLGDVFKGKGISKTEVKNSGIPCIRYGELYTTYNYFFDETVSFVDSDSAALSQEIKMNDILFAGSGETAEEIGKCVAYLGSKKAFAGGDIIILRPSKVESRFLAFMLNHSVVVKQKSMLGQGNSVVHLYPKSLSEIWVPIPPQKEQKKIGEILSNYEIANRKLNSLIRLKTLLKIDLQSKLLKKQPKSKSTWVDIRLGDHCKYQNGFAFKSKYFNTETGIRLIKNRDLKNDGQVVFTTEEYLDEYKVKNGDLLIGMDGDFLPCLWDKGAALLNQRVGRITNFSNSLDKTYLYYVLISQLKKVESDTSSTTVKHLSSGVVENLNINIPSKITEQKTIASTLLALDKEISMLELQQNKIERQKQGLMQNILMGKIRMKK